MYDMSGDLNNDRSALYQHLLPLCWSSVVWCGMVYHAHVILTTLYGVYHIRMVLTVWYDMSGDSMRGVPCISISYLSVGTHSGPHLRVLSLPGSPQGQWGRHHS